MKKSIIALAVAGALTAPLAQADATLYGIAEFRLTDADTKSLSATMSKTRLGVKGTVDNDIEGLTTGFQFEWEMDGNAQGTASSNTFRKSLVYVKGDNWGQVTFGTQNNPGATYKTTNYGIYSDNWGPVTDRVANAISYWSPSFGGFQVVGGIVADGGDQATSNDVDASSVGVNYSMGGLYVGATYNATNSKTANADVDTTGVGVSYTMGDLYLAVDYSDRDAESGASVKDAKLLGLNAVYTIDKTTLYAAHEAQDIDGQADDNKATYVGVSYALGSAASVALETVNYNTASGLNDATTLQYTLNF